MIFTQDLMHIFFGSIKNNRITPFIFAVFILIFSEGIVSAQSAKLNASTGSGNTETFCSGSSTSVVFSVTATVTTPVKYIYTIDGLNPDTITTINTTPYSFSINAEGSYELIDCIDGNGISVNINGGNSTVTVTELEQPSVFITPDPAYVNIGSNLTLTANTSNGLSPYTYSWGGSVSGTTDTVTFTSVASGSYSVSTTVTDANSCSATNNLTVNVTNLTASVSPLSGQICEGGTISLNATPANGTGFYTHSWTYSASGGGTGSFSNDTIEDPTFTATSDDTYTLEYTVTDTKTGATATATATVTANPLPDTKTLTATNYCSGASGGKIVLSSSDVGVDYTLKINSTDYPILSLSGDGGNLTWSALKTSDSIEYYYITATNTTTLCTTDFDSIAIVKNALPTLSPSADNNSICKGSTTTLHTNATSAAPISSYSWSNGSTDPEPDVSPTSSETYSVTVTDGNGCKNSGSVNVEVISLPSINLSDNKDSTFTVCENNSITLTASSVKIISKWDWSPAPSSLSSTTKSSSATYSPSTNTPYSLTVTDTSGCENTANVTVTVDDQPTANAGSDVKICNGSTTTLTASANGGTLPYSYEWNNGDLSDETDVSPSSNGTYTVTVTDSNGCSHSDDVEVTVVTNPSVTADIVTGYTTSICDGDSTKLSATASGGSGTYSYNWLPGGLSNSLITVSPTNSTYDDPPATQTYTVSITDGNGCTATDSIDVTIFSLTSLTINNDGEEYCKDEGTVTLTGNPSNDSVVWSSTSPSFFSGANTFNTTTNTQGTYNITYEYTNSNGCTSSTTGAVTILPYNTPNIMDIDIQDGNDYCHTDAGSYVITGVLNPDISDETGVNETISGTGVTEISPGNFVFTPGTAGTGIHVITYTVTTPGCSSSYTDTVSVGLPVSINAPTDMCVGDTNQTLTADDTTGVWRIEFTDTSGNGSSIGPIAYNNPNAILKASKPGTYSVLYELTSGTFACSNTSTVTCVVHALPDLSFKIDTFSHDDLDINFCTNNGNASLIGYNNGVLAGGGSFSGTGVSGAFFDPSTGAGNYNITYTYTDPNGCSSSVTSNNIQVNGAPDVDITGLDSSYCSDDAIFTISGDPTSGNMGIPGAFTFPASWTDSIQYTDNGDGTAKIDPANIGTYGTYSITYSINDINGCIGTTTETFTINSIPSVDITGIPVSGTICKSASPITITGSPTNSNGWFSIISGLTDNGDGTATFYPDSAAVGNHTITYNYTNPTTGCSNSVAENIKVLPIPEQYTIVAPAGYEYCEGDPGVVLGVSNSQSTYIYNLVRDGSTTVSTDTSSANGAFNFAGTYTNGDYTVRAIHPVSGCSVTFNNVITVTEVPAIDDAGNISGSTSICADGTSIYTYSVPAIANVTDYVWTLPANVTLNYDGGDTISVTYNAAFVSGSIEVYGTNPGYTACPDGASSSISVSARPLPVINGSPSISGDDVVCKGETGKTYTINATDFDNETSYEWQTTVGTITSSSSASSVNVSFLTGGVNGTIRVRGVNACGTSAWLSFPVTVNGTPNVSINSLTALDIITCSSSSQVQLNAASTENAANITGWSWSTSNGGIIVAGDETSQNPFVSHEGDYIVQIEVTTNGQACYNTDTVTVGANRTAPSLSIDSPDVLTCSDTTVTLQANATNVDYSWSFTPPANIVGATNTDAPVVNKPGTYTVDVTDKSNFCTSSASVTVSQDTAAPNISVTNPATNKLTCTVSSVNIEGNSTTTGATYEWTTLVSGATITTPNNSSAQADMAGVYILEVTDPSNGCTSSRNVTVNENTTVPTITALTNNDGALTCNTTTVELEAEVASVSNATFTWSTSGGTIVSTYGTYNQFASVSAAGNYTVEATHPESGCTDTESITVSSNYAIPTINIAPEATVITCSQQKIKLDASSSVNVGSFAWTASAGGNIDYGSTTHTATISQAGTYTLTATHQTTGCQTTSSVYITENTAKPSVNITGTPYTLTCTDPTLVLSATADSGTSISWTGPGVITNPNTLNPTVDSAGLYTITATASNGCSMSDNVLVQENTSVPDINVNKNPGNITCNNTSVNISGNSSVSGVTYKWQVVSGSATLTKATNPTATVNGDGQFRLTVTAPNGCTNSDDVTVGIDTLSPKLFLPAIDGNLLTCDSTEVQLDGDSSTSGAQFSWSTTVIGATITDNASPTPWVDKPGNYTVTVTDPTNGCTTTGTTSVSGNYATPTINIVPDSTEITCSRPTITLDASSSTNVGNFTWTASPGGNITSGSTTNTATISQAGTYTLIATHSTTGCQDTSSVSITANTAKPSAPIPGTSYTLTCKDTALVLSATVAPNTTIKWTSPGPGVIEDDDTPTPTIHVAGTYTITTTATNGCSSSANVAVNEDKADPDISVNKNPGNITCSNTTIDIKGSSFTPGATYNWKVISGSAVLTNATTPTATVNDKGQFRLTVTAPNGCTNSDIVTVGIDTASPVLTLPAVDGDLLTCDSTAVELDGGSTTPGVQFSWSTTVSGATIKYPATATPEVDKTGDYTVVVTDPTNGCTTTGTTSVLGDYSTPTVSISPVTDKITCTNTSIQLNASGSSNAGSYLWTASNGGNITAGATTATPTINAAGRYTVTVKHNVTGCTASDYINILQDSSIPTIDSFDPYPATLTCSTGSVSLLADASSLTTNKSIVWTTSDGNFTSATDITNPTVDEPGTYMVTITNTDNGCSSVRGVTVEQNITPPSIQIDTPNKLTCSVSQVSLKATAASVDGSSLSYAWSAGPGGIISSGASTSNPTVTAAANYNLIVTDLGNSCSNSSTVTVAIDTVAPDVSVDTSPNSITCDSTTVQLNGLSTYPNVSYQWNTSGGGTIINANTTTPIVNKAGIYFLTVKNLDNNCTTTSANVYVNENVVTPSVTMFAPSGDITCSVSSVTLSASQNTDYTYSWTGPGNISNANSYTTDVDAAGSYSLIITDIYNGCDTTYSVTVNEDKAVPSAPIINNEEVCYGAANPAFTVLTGSDVKWYSNSALTGYLAGGISYTPTDSNTGVHSYYATSTASNGCTSLQTEVTLTIHNLPINPVTVDASICEGSAGQALNAIGNDIQWYNVGGSYLASGTTYVPTDVATGTYTYFASQTDNNGCESSREPATYTIKPVPSAPVLVDANLEACETEVIPSFSVSGVNIKWYRNLSGSVISTASSFQHTQTTPGTFTYYVTQSANGCESPYETATINIIEAPAEYTVTGGGTYCEGTGGLSVGLSGSQTGITYELWLDGADMIIDVTGTGSPIDFGLQTEPGTYTVRAYNTPTLCGKIMGSNVKIIMDPLPGGAPIITGDSVICQMASGLTYTVSPIPDATKYIWSLPSGFNITSGDNSESITVETDNTATDGIITVYAENGCGTGSVSPNFYINVNEIPGNAVTINGPATVCSNETGVTYSVDAIQGATSYVWTLPTGATIISGHNTRQIMVDFSVLSVTDDISVYGVNDCGNGASASKMITVNTPPTADAGNDQEICSDQTTLAADGLATGESGFWTLYDGAASFSNPAQTNANATGIAKGNNIFVWTVSDANGCSGTDTVNIYNNLIPIDAGDDQIICSNKTNLQAVTPTIGGHWEFVDASATIVNNYSPNSEVLYLGRGENTFAWVAENNSCRSSDTVTITNNSPVIPDAGDDQIIESVQTYLDAESPKSGESGLWKIYNGGGTIIDKTDAKSQVTDLVSGDNIFVWTVTKGSCSLSDTVTITNTLDEDPEAGVTQTICANTTQLNATVPDIGLGEWSVKVNHGSATFEDVNDPKTKVYNLGLGENWLIWTVSTSSHSSRYDSVLITNNQVTEANAGADRTLCVDSALLAANTPLYGAGKWTISGGSGNFDNETNPAATIKDLSSGENVLKWTIINKTCSSEDYVTIINNTPTEANAGNDQTICTDSTVLLPNTPTVGKASWSVISGTGTFEGNIVTQLAPDTNIFLYTIAQGSCNSYDIVNIINNRPTTPTAGYDKSLCVDTIKLQANQPAEGTATWSIINGSGAFEDKTDPNTIVRNLASSLNIFRWTISKNGCIEQDEVKIYNNSVTAEAGEDITLCEDEYELIAANNTIGIGTWSIVGASGANFENKNAPNTMVTNLSNGANQLRWTVKKENCVVHDDIIITSNKPTDASAGVDRAVCSKEVVLTANTPVYGSGEWILMDGSGTFSDESDPNSTITNLSVGKNLLRWTITQGECTSYDDINITSNLPVNVFAGSDQVSCSDIAALGANKASIGIGQWSIIKGSGTFTDANYHETSVHNLAKGENIFKWTVSSSDCSISDTVVITSTVPTSAYAGPNRILCADSSVLAGNSPLVGNGEWLLISGSAIFDTPNSPTSKVSGLALGENILRWTISKDGCYSYDEIILTNNLPSIPFAGYDETLCIDSTKLYAAPPTLGTGTWSLVSGDAVIVEPNSNQTSVTNIDLGENTFRWTITNQNCKLSDDVIITSNYEIANAGLDETVHTSSVQLIGNNPSSGTGEWKLSAGSGTIVTPENVETMVTNLSSGANIFTWTITNGDCTTSDDVSINYIESPILGFEPSSLEGCPPITIKFVNTTVGGSTYVWDFGDGATSTENSPSHTFTEEGQYTVKLTAYASLGTSNVLDTIITIHQNPVAIFEIAPDTVYIPDEHISCYNYSEGADSSIWYFGDGNYLTGYAPTYTYTEEGSYNIGLKVISEKGCTDSLTTYNAVYVKKRNDFFFPEAFTPNIGGGSGGTYSMSDRSNDVFYPIMVDGELLEFELKIYSRLGVMVFSTKDINVGWDGYYKGRLLPQDVYIYIVTGKYNSGKSFQRTGNVLLLLNEK